MTDEVEQHRSALFGLAYRMLGSVMDAEDIVQEAFIRWQNTPDAEVRSSRAYLMTIVTRLCVDHLRLAHVKREAYVGMWLPEPLMQSTESNDPAHIVELDESISTAFMVLMESLAPLDRAVFLLHEVFSYTFADIAGIVGRTPDDCRQIGHRARQRVNHGRPRYEVTTDTVERIVQEFLGACLDGDISELLVLLNPAVVVTNDSGGKVSAVRNDILGADRVARLFLGVFHRWSAHLTFQIEAVNGQSALIFYTGEQPVCVASFELCDGQILHIYQVFNPDKLKRITSRADSTDHGEHSANDRNSSEQDDT